MNENSSHFRLAYSSLLFHHKVIKQIRSYRQNLQAQDLIWNDINLEVNDRELLQLLKLLY